MGEFSLSKDLSRGFSAQIEKHLIHPNYDGKTAYFDVGVIQTEHIEFSPNVQPICLPAKFSVDRDMYKNHLVELVGMSEDCLILHVVKW